MAKTPKKKTATKKVSPSHATGLVSYDYRGSRHTGTVVGVAKNDTHRTKKSG